MIKQFVSSDGTTTATLVVSTNDAELELIRKISYLDHSKPVYRMAQEEGAYAYFNEDHLRAIEFEPVKEVGGLNPSRMEGGTFVDNFYLDIFKYCGDLYTRVTEDDEEEVHMYERSSSPENPIVLQDVNEFITDNDTLEVIQVTKKDTSEVISVGDIDPGGYILDEILVNVEGDLVKAHFSLIENDGPAPAPGYLVAKNSGRGVVAGQFTAVDNIHDYDDQGVDFVLCTTRESALEQSMMYRRALSVDDVAGILRAGLTREELVVTLMDIVESRTN